MIRKSLLAFFVTAVMATSVQASSGSSSKPLAGTYPIILSHGLFGWGENSGGIISIVNYWGGTDDYLRSQGATVFAPTKTAANSNEVRAQELKAAILTYAAATNYNGKFHILGHSQGGLDSRYMVSNLGLAGRTATLTTLNTPHYGSPIADIVKTVLPSWIQPFVASIVETLVKIVYGGTNQQNALAALSSLSKEGLSSFNAYTPNNSAVKYFSYGSSITIPDLIQHPLMGILHPACGAGGLFQGQGFTNDGLVPLSSQKWGTWKGGPSYGILTTGIDHLQVSNTLRSGSLWYDVEGFYLNMASNMKANQ
ncbi:lipase [Leptospira sp. 2 VSF19]|uniref:Lipase n=1 Tax=Leptospira soteropolitanensis TaxID=2950025 RepID=A0AAW5VQH7_9LEPT|nr:lipase [Leptospira soteropolitanensis]MCW7493991.1 lipase [Leptospira soteropolitanensis]MCW7501585.1 lipase [Leptospira soteropolitanensis]MCW7523653.1 lipase [Leptospira soteropolitanensis]MCW7527516.1 lipase [Leptospira soteropolitanensis]MCW7531370.1 lipase [Leptospira soteropolitanensis]